MFIPDDAHRRRVAAAVEHATSTGDVTLTLTPTEADNLHTLVVNQYRQVREELDQPVRNMILAVLQVLDEATKAAFAREEARRQHYWRFADRAAAVLLGNLDLKLTGTQLAQLVGAVSALASSPSALEKYAVDKVVNRLAELSRVDVTDLGRRAQLQAVGKKLLAIYRETETVTA
jgi:hypothetical protein